MIEIHSLRKVSRQIVAIVEKQIALNLRFKFEIIRMNIAPVINFLMPFILIGFVLGNYEKIGYWNNGNYIPFLIIGFQVSLLYNIIYEIPTNFLHEKFWGTLPALLIAPVHRFTLLAGMLLSKLILVAIPFTLFLVINLIIFPCSLLTFISVLMIFLSISIILLGIAAILCPFSIGNESVWQALTFFLAFVLIFSAFNFPIEVFPDVLQWIIRINPMYYYFDILRLIWMENNLLLSFSAHGYHFLILISSVVISPIIGVKVFNIFYNKLEIQG